MCRVDLGPIREALEFFVETVVEVFDLFFEQVGAGQVGAADIADKEQVAGEECEDILGPSVVGDGKGDGVWRMAEGFDDFDFAGAKTEVIALVEVLVRVGGFHTGMHIDVGAGAGSQFAATGDVVGMQMGIEDVGDAQAIFLCDLEVAIDMAFGVDDAGNASGGAADHIGQTAQTFDLELLKQHTRSSFADVERQWVETWFQRNRGSFTRGRRPCGWRLQ